MLYFRRLYFPIAEVSYISLLNLNGWICYENLISKFLNCYKLLYYIQILHFHWKNSFESFKTHYKLPKNPPKNVGILGTVFLICWDPIFTANYDQKHKTSSVILVKSRKSWVTCSAKSKLPPAIKISNKIHKIIILKNYGILWKFMEFYEKFR